MPRSLRSSVVYKLLVWDVIPFILAKHLAIFPLVCVNIYSHIFKHLKSLDSCKDACGESCFRVLDSSSSYHSSRIKEALYIIWERPNVNEQLNHYNVSLNF